MKEEIWGDVFYLGKPKKPKRCNGTHVRHHWGYGKGFRRCWRCGKEE